MKAEVVDTRCPVCWQHVPYGVRFYKHLDTIGRLCPMSSQPSVEVLV